MNQIQAVINLLMIGKVMIPNKGLEAGRLAVITLDQGHDLGHSVELNPVDTIGTVQGQDLSPEILDNMMVVQGPDLTLEIFVTKNIFSGQTAPPTPPIQTNHPSRDFGGRSPYCNNCHKSGHETRDCFS